MNQHFLFRAATLASTLTANVAAAQVGALLGLPLHNRVGMGQRAHDSTRQAFIAASQVRHQFAKFYSSSAGHWLVLSTSWGDREADIRWRWVACPAFDSASFQNEYPFWHDQHRVAHACLFCHQQRVELILGADPATFHSLGVDDLAADKNHVYQGTYPIPDLRPAGLRVYTYQGEHYTNGPNSNGMTTYLVNGNVIYAPGLNRLTEEQARHFRLPAGYQLVYSSLPAAPAKASNAH